MVIRQQWFPITNHSDFFQNSLKSVGVVLLTLVEPAASNDLKKKPRHDITS